MLTWQVNEKSYNLIFFRISSTNPLSNPITISIVAKCNGPLINGALHHRQVFFITVLAFLTLFNSQVQTPTSQPWTAGYTTSTPQTSFVPMTSMVYNYSNQFGMNNCLRSAYNFTFKGQNMSSGMFQSNGSQQQQTIK